MTTQNTEPVPTLDIARILGQIEGRMAEQSAQLQGIREEIQHTNARIDQSNARLDAGLQQTNARIDAGLQQTNARIDQTNARIDQSNARLDKLFLTTLAVGSAVTATLIGVLATMIIQG